MTRKGAWAGLSFWAALAASATFRGQYDLMLLLAALAVAAASFFAGKLTRKYVIFCAAFFISGIIVSSIYTSFVYDRVIDADGSTVTIDGYITDLAGVSGNTTRVTVCGKVNGASATVSFLLPETELDYYEDITITGEVSKIQDNIKFVSEQYYYPRGVFLEGGFTYDYTLSGRIRRPVLSAFRHYRDRLFSLITEISPGDEGAFLGAMLCGDKSELSPAVRTAMNRIGLGHIVAVSGTHLAVTSAIFGEILSLFIVSRRKRHFLLLAEIWCFALFSGFAVPVVRAAIMLTLSSSGFLFGRESDCANSLGISAILLTTAQPYAAISVSFVLSFLSVAAIGIIAPRLPRPKTEGRLRRSLVNSLYSSVSVVLLTAPACVYFFGTVSVFSIVSNLLLTPVCSAALILCSIVLFTGGLYILAYPLIFVARLLAAPVLYLTLAAARLPFSSICTVHPVLSATVVVTAVLPLCYGLLFKDRRRFAAFCTAVIFLWFTVSNVYQLISDRPRLIVLPNGSSSAYICVQGNTAEIFDVGCRGRMNRPLRSYMERYGIVETDCAFVSVGGQSAALDYPSEFLGAPAVVFVPEIAEEGPGATDTVIRVLSEGTSVSTGNITVEFRDGAYLVSYGDSELTLTKTGFTAGDKFYPTENEAFPLELDLETMTVRRLSYAFNYSI